MCYTESKSVKVCIDRVIKPGVDMLRRKNPRAAADKERMWKPGQTLKIQFMDGSRPLQDRVKEVASEWMLYANLRFDFGEFTDPQIRLSFLQRGSWSYVGTDALLADKDKPTINLGWVTVDTDDEEFMRVTLHEFGHLLGFIHEHQSPAGQIPWNEQAVIDFYSGPPNYWTEDRVRFNIFNKYSEEQTMHTEFDFESIMRYPIPREHLSDPTWADKHNTTWQNYKLSDTDKQFALKCYPFDHSTFVPVVAR